jgi:hypothetical protein
VSEKERRPAKRANDSSSCRCSSIRLISRAPYLDTSFGLRQTDSPNSPIPPSFSTTIRFHISIFMRILPSPLPSLSVLPAQLHELAIFSAVRTSLLLVDFSCLPLVCSPAYPHMRRAAPAILVNGAAIRCSDNAALPPEQCARNFYCIACGSRTCTAQWCRRLYA